MKRLTNEQFITKAKEIHGDKYDYSKVEYVNKNTKVCIICPEHGEFWQTPDNHFKGQNCPKCANITRGDVFRKNKEWFIQEAKKIHGDKYDYSKVEYKNIRTKVCIICPIHGEFWQCPYSHLKGFGCKKCNAVFDTDTFIKQATEIYGNTYDYSKVKYEYSKKEVCIICPKHGEFWVTPNQHLRGRNCPKCVEERRKDNFFERAIKIHGNKYDYSKVNYEHSFKKICIICPKHGEFWQTPSSHLEGVGCPMCKQSFLEEEVDFFLNEKLFDVERQKKFNWLGLQSLDFYIPNYNVAIECQGIQHFKVVKNWGGDNKLKHQKELDKLKKKLCEEHNIKLLYFTHEDYETFLGEKLIKTTDDLLKKVKENEEV